MATPFYCHKCGTHLLPDSSFCPACGTPRATSQDNPTHRQQPSQALPDQGTGRLPPGRVLHQRYRLLHVMGRGGMGAVYLAQDSQLGDRLVAVKEMSMSRLMPQGLPHAIAQFRNEAHLLASLQHTNLPVIYEYFNEGERWYLVMSFIEGQSLQAVLDTTPGQKLPPKDALRIGIELCNVLDYLHSHQPQIIFRDLKPSNIMLTPTGHIYLIDFGIARHFKQEQTRDTIYYYSVGYAPPEQYGQSQTSPQSDIYSLGATLHQILSGQNPTGKPFQFTPLQFIDPTIPAPLTRLITQMLDMKEHARPTSVTQVKAQLEQLLAPTSKQPAQIEPTIKHPTEQQKPIVIAPASPAQYTLPSNQQQPRNLWADLIDFLERHKIVAWISFIIVSLTTSLLIGGLTNSMYWGLLHVGKSATGIGAAIIGLLFLTIRNRTLLDRIGGLAFTLIWTIGSLFDYLINLNVYNDYFFYYLLYYDDFLYAYHKQNYLHTAIYIILCIICIIIGSHAFTKKVKNNGKLVFGIYLIASSVFSSPIFFLIHENHDIKFIDFNYLIAPLPLTQIIVGVTTIIITFRRRKNSKGSLKSYGA